MLSPVPSVPRPQRPTQSSWPRFGAFLTEGGVVFRGFTDAPELAVRLFDEEEAPLGTHPMRPLGAGVFEVFIAGAGPGQLYKLVVEGRELPDPYARSLPRGVHGPAAVVAALAPLQGPRRPVRLDGGAVLYELHVGTFTAEGTFRSAMERLPALAQLGVTAVELLPVAAFPGQRGWGYDGVALYAPFAPYGSLDDLRAFIEAAHALGLGVLLDVVYNHLGPDGAYLGAFSRRYYRAEAAGTWGDRPAADDGPFAALVIDNARFWLEEVGFDGLRLDATHALEPGGDPHILRRLADACAALPGPPVLIAEDERNDPAVVESLGVDGVWADDLHHVAHVLVTGERDGYYAGYTPSVAELARCLREGWVYSGQSWPLSGEPRGKPRGSLPRARLVTSLQNHDQVGNRALGERLSSLVDGDTYAAVALLFLLAPTTPLLFMGEEWGSRRPFLFFTDHHEELGRAVVEGRRKEFRSFAAFADEAHAAQIPSPQELRTFEACVLDHGEAEREPHAALRRMYQEALAVRRTEVVPRREDLRAEAEGSLLVVRYGADRVLLVSFGDEAVPVAPHLGGVPARLLVATPSTAAHLGAASTHALEEGATLPPRGAAFFALTGGAS